MNTPSPFATNAPNPLESDDPVTWERLLDAVGPASLLVFARRRLRGELARLMSDEDVVQEALLHAWRDRRSFQWRGLRSFRRWLLQILENRILRLAEWSDAEIHRGEGKAIPFSQLADAGSTGSRDGDPIARFGPIGSTTPSRIASLREEAAAMNEAIDSLPDELREVVELRLLRELPIEEVAARTNLKNSAVRHRFRKGLHLYQERARRALISRSHAPEAKRRLDAGGGA